MDTQNSNTQNIERSPLFILSEDENVRGKGKFTTLALDHIKSITQPKYKFPPDTHGKALVYFTIRTEDKMCYAVGFKPVARELVEQAEAAMDEVHAYLHDVLAENKEGFIGICKGIFIDISKGEKLPC